ncbi:hypothetical protein HPB47_011569 [Ixodes persulcatus]|uniref:Uncharacterized protein n=1 Tax=Ixodes persulcatus TaxID=34615 RepID=A0AC60NVX3_IXOPE|nr:hypothetical protein HPB47_011569 [Ixodes persulcatus]
MWCSTGARSRSPCPGLWIVLPTPALRRLAVPGYHSPSLAAEPLRDCHGPRRYGQGMTFPPVLLQTLLVHRSGDRHGPDQPDRLRRSCPAPAFRSTLCLVPDRDTLADRLSRAFRLPISSPTLSPPQGLDFRGLAVFRISWASERSSSASMDRGDRWLFSKPADNVDLSTARYQDAAGDCSKLPPLPMTTLCIFRRLFAWAEDVSVEEFTEALEEVRGREQEERRKRADEKALEKARWEVETARWELEKREHKCEMERLDYEFEQLELAKKTRELESLRRATTGVEGVTGKACQEKEKVGAGDTELTKDQRFSPDTTVTVHLETDPNPERRGGESDVAAATELVCQEKKKAEAGATKVTGNQRVSSDATDAVPRKTYPTPELREREEKALRASSCDSPEDEGDAKTETTPGESSQLMESGAEMPDKVVQQSSQDLNRSDRHPCGFRTKPTVPSQESKRPTRREVIEISFDEINRSCLVRFRSPDFRPFAESRGQENDDECASGSESSSTLEDGRPKVGHPKEPATGCAGKGPSGVTIEPGRDKVHLTTSSCPRQGGAETKNSDVVTRQRPRPMKKRERRISVVRSGSDAPCKKRPGKRDERHFKKKKLSSLLGGGKLQDPHPIEPRTPQLKCEQGAWRRQQRAWNDATRFQTEAGLIAPWFSQASRRTGKPREISGTAASRPQVQGEELELFE